MGQDPPYKVQTASTFSASPNRSNHVRGLRHTLPSGRGRLKNRFSDGLKPYRQSVFQKTQLA
ncbi:hypothetical protein H3L91_09625 [Neisseria bacilliformis]|uniref:hypothetical protein n=1 Tax=Neisseria bacilliformis TaxID=267212 RepID=UPI0012B637FC|nr:hypothetical protein [Neisseria bacilliformis]QMT47168.1 hypothetical protein H3L91_09625 [Neisseria bacilliformis]